MKKTIKARDVAKRLIGGKLSEIATYSDLFQRTSDVIFLLEPDTVEVLECNPMAMKLLGSQNPEGQPFLRWAAPQSLETAKKNLASLTADNAPETSFDFIFLNHSHEEIILEVSARRLKLADYCEVIQLMAKDVSAERKAAQELLQANHKLAILSNTDEMTKLFNFRYFKAELAKEHARARRHGHPYCIIICDIDHFKNYNDKNGHMEGDEALKKTAQLLQSRVRETDIVARYGGEEFVILCPELDSSKARIVAEELRKRVEGEIYAHGHKQPMGKLTISVGAASFPADGAEPEEILRLADKALYTAKSEGRNQIRVHSNAGAQRKAA